MQQMRRVRVPLIVLRGFTTLSPALNPTCRHRNPKRALLLQNKCRSRFFFDLFVHAADCMCSPLKRGSGLSAAVLLRASPFQHDRYNPSLTTRVREADAGEKSFFHQQHVPRVSVAALVPGTTAPTGANTQNTHVFPRFSFQTESESGGPCSPLRSTLALN